MTRRCHYVERKSRIAATWLSIATPRSGIVSRDKNNTRLTKTSRCPEIVSNQRINIDQTAVNCITWMDKLRKITHTDVTSVSERYSMNRKGSVLCAKLKLLCTHNVSFKWMRKIESFIFSCGIQRTKIETFQKYLKII